MWTSSLIGFVFLAASVSKWWGRDTFRQFATSLRDMRVLPAGLVPPIAVFVVVAESAVWMLLAMPVAITAVTGLVLATGLLAAFAGGIGSVLRRGVRASCRCFGPSATPFAVHHVVRNVALACLAVLGLLAWIRPGEASAGGAVVAIASGLLLGGVITVLDDLVDLFQPVGARRRLPRNGR